MNPTIDIIHCDPDVPAGVFTELLREQAVPYRSIRADLGEPLPERSLAVIVLGGTMGVHDEVLHPFLKPLKEYLGRLQGAGTPLLGICLGGQLLADVAGGTVSSNCCGEKGLVEVTLTAAGVRDQLFAGVDGTFRAFAWHNDSFAIPPGAIHLAHSTTCCGQAFRVGNSWGLQFHPEVDAAIVADWSRRSHDRVRLCAEFALAAPVHRELARQLLGNFVAATGSGAPA